MLIIDKQKTCVITINNKHIVGVYQVLLFCGRWDFGLLRIQDEFWYIVVYCTVQNSSRVNCMSLANIYPAKYQLKICNSVIDKSLCCRVSCWCCWSSIKKPDFPDLVIDWQWWVSSKLLTGKKINDIKDNERRPME